MQSEMPQSPSTPSKKLERSEVYSQGERWRSKPPDKGFWVAAVTNYRNLAPNINLLPHSSKGHKSNMGITG